MASAARTRVAQNSRRPTRHDHAGRGRRCRHPCVRRSLPDSRTVAADRRTSPRSCQSSSAVSCHGGARQPIADRTDRADHRPSPRCRRCRCRDLRPAEHRHRRVNRPRCARSASVTAPWRLARRDPSGASTSGTWAYCGSGRSSSRCSMICRGVDANRSSPRTTSVTPCAASSTTTARL